MEVAQKTKSYKGELFVIISAIGFGTMGVIGKLAYKEGLNTQTLLTLRFLFASLLLFIILKVKGKSLKIPRAHIKSYFFLGTILYTLVSFFYFFALNYISASLTVVLFFLYPIYVTVISIVFLKDKMTTIKLICLIMSFLGIFIIVSPGNAQINMTGIILSFIGGFLYAIYVLLLGASNIKHTDSLITGFYINIFSAFGMGTWAFASQNFIYSINAAAFGYAVLLGLFASAVAIMAFFAGVKLIGPVKASIIANVEPLAAVLLATIVLSESLSLTQLLGGLLIIAAVIIISLPSSIVIKK